MPTDQPRRRAALSPVPGSRHRAAEGARQRCRSGTSCCVRLATVAPVDVATLTAAAHLSPTQVESVLGDLAAAGAITRNPAGPVVAAGGLSVIPARHWLRLIGRQFWTWCAFDGIGIPAALDLDAALDTRCPHCGQPIQVAIDAGRPPTDSSMVGWLPGGLRQRPGRLLPRREPVLQRRAPGRLAHDRR